MSNESNDPRPESDAEPEKVQHEPFACSGNVEASEATLPPHSSANTTSTSYAEFEKVRPEPSEDLGMPQAAGTEMPLEQTVDQSQGPEAGIPETAEYYHRRISKWTVEELEFYAGKLSKGIDGIETSLTSDYWYLGEMLLTLQPKVAHGEWIQRLKSMGIKKTRWEKAKAIRQTFPDVAQCKNISVEKAYESRGRKQKQDHSKRPRSGSSSTMTRRTALQVYRESGSPDNTQDVIAARLLSNQGNKAGVHEVPTEAATVDDAQPVSAEELVHLDGLAVATVLSNAPSLNDASEPDDEQEGQSANTDANDDANSGESEEDHSGEDDVQPNEGEIAKFIRFVAMAVDSSKPKDTYEDFLALVEQCKGSTKRAAAVVTVLIARITSAAEHSLETCEEING